MPISEKQLEVWSHQGQTTAAKATYASIRNALSQGGFSYDGKDFEIYLQGSYKNDTNIRGDSDVDIVVQLNSTFHRDLSLLPTAERLLYEAVHHPATYTLQEFRRAVLDTLSNYYGSGFVSPGNSAIKVTGSQGKLNADVVVVTQYRRYRRFRSLSDQHYNEGITFLAIHDNRWVVNYPKLHYEAGVEKQSATGDWYKPTIRAFKNTRAYLVDRGVISDDLAPSYFIECLLYNVPNQCFGGTFQDTFSEILAWLSRADTSKLICQNQQTSLCGSTPEQWPLPSAQEFISLLSYYWNHY